MNVLHFFNFKGIYTLLMQIKICHKIRIFSDIQILSCGNFYDFSISAFLQMPTPPTLWLTIYCNNPCQSAPTSLGGADAIVHVQLQFVVSIGALWCGLSENPQNLVPWLLADLWGAP